MSYQEKKTVVSISTGILLMVAYCIYAFGGAQAGMAAPENLKHWATTILIFIGIGVVASIVIQIVFHILLSVALAVKEKMQNGNCDDKEIEKTVELEMVEDEMDKLIALKSMRIGFGIAGVGFVAALVSLVLGFSPVVMINTIFLSFSVGTMAEGFVQLHYYRKGIKNG